MIANTIIVIGTSAGGVLALRSLLACFGANWPVSVFITIHTGKNRSLMPDILNHSTPMHATFAEHQKIFRSGTIYVAPPDRHLVIGHTSTFLSAGPKENHTRPAIDPMFRSAAQHHGRNVIGVLLTGYLFDGANGLFDIQQCGGTTIVQDPINAEVPEIPQNALLRLKPDYVVPLADIPMLIDQHLLQQKGAKVHGGGHD
jgi:two-component system, chemotaxis family, protein-glutamate methylesterase/glutaminase